MDRQGRSRLEEGLDVHPFQQRPTAHRDLPDGKNLFVAYSASGTVSTVDDANGTVFTTVSTGQ